MKIGSALTISIKEPNERERQLYKSKLIDKTNTHLIIDYPIELNKKNIMIRPKDQITVDYVHGNTVYRFHATVENVLLSPLKTIAIPVPEKDELIKIQRREYVRIPTDANIAVYSSTNAFKPFTTVTQDISGGGVAIILPKNVELSLVDRVQLYIVLKSKQSNFEYFTTEAEPVRVFTLEGVRIASFKFVLEQEKDRQKIIKYCFDVQRDNLKQVSLLSN